jgi:organic radical activating enzyme
MFLFNNPLFFKQQNQILENIKKAGFELMENGKINKRTKKIIQQNITSKKEYAQSTDFFWQEKFRTNDINGY